LKQFYYLDGAGSIAAGAIAVITSYLKEAVMDLLLINGEIHIRHCPEKAQWLLVRDGIICDYGQGEFPGENANQDMETINLKGAFATAGFFDSHVHLVQSGIDAMSLKLNAAESIGEVLELINAYAQTAPPGSLIRGIGFDEAKSAEGRMPTRYELDYCAPNNPVWINRLEYHVSVVNTLALNMLNIPFNIEGLHRNRKNLPDGGLTGAANAFARKKILQSIDGQVRKQGVAQVIQKAVSRGVTTLNAMEGGYNFCEEDFRFVLAHQRAMPIDVEIFCQTLDVEKVQSLGLKRIGGDIFVDGSFGSRTAALFEPYADDPLEYGRLYFREEEIDDFIVAAHNAGLQIALHAIGDRAIEQVIIGYEKAIKANPRQHRHRIEHFEMANDSQVERAADLGIIVSMQPAFELHWGHPGGMYEQRLGRYRYRNTNRFSFLQKKGLVIAGGSDSDITPIDPLAGINAAVNHPKGEYAVGAAEALDMFTYNAAFALGQEVAKGSLDRGKRGDIVVLDRNPLKVGRGELVALKVLYTIKDGNIIYCNQGLGLGDGNA
jgi:hypothetical protein